MLGTGVGITTVVALGAITGVTHDPGTAGRADRIVRMLDGRNAGEEIRVRSFPRRRSAESPMLPALPEETIG